MSLAEQFQQSRGKPIMVGDQQIIQMYAIEMPTRAQVQLKWVSTHSNLKQGIKIKLDKGDISVEGKKYQFIVLWQDTSPNIVNFTCLPKKKNSVLKIWNVWEIDGIEQAWVGDAGIVIDQTQTDLFRLNCSNGVDGPNFNDLIFEVFVSKE